MAYISISLIACLIILTVCLNTHNYLKKNEPIEKITYKEHNDSIPDLDSLWQQTEFMETVID